MKVLIEIVVEFLRETYQNKRVGELSWTQWIGKQDSQDCTWYTLFDYPTLRLILLLLAKRRAR